MSNMNVLTHYTIYKLHGNGRHGRHETTSHKNTNILIKLKKTKWRQLYHIDITF